MESNCIYWNHGRLTQFPLYTYLHINKLESFNILVIFAVVEEFDPGHSAAACSLYDLGNTSLNLFKDLLFMLYNEVLGLLISKDFFL